MLSSSWYSDPRASGQLAKAQETPMSAAAGIVVTEMNTPSRALVLDWVSETIPTTPARTATTTEKKFGVLIRLDTGLRPRSNPSGWSPRPRTSSANSRVISTASRKPHSSASSPSRTLPRSCRSMPSATLVMAPYSGPTTIAATIRICELVMIPTEPISPAMTR